jgi:hypothetical protein
MEMENVMRTLPCEIGCYHSHFVAVFSGILVNFSLVQRVRKSDNDTSGTAQVAQIAQVSWLSQGPALYTNTAKTQDSSSFEKAAFGAVIQVGVISRCTLFDNRSVHFQKVKY